MGSFTKFEPVGYYFGGFSYGLESIVCVIGDWLCKQCRRQTSSDHSCLNLIAIWALGNGPVYLICLPVKC